MSLRAIQKRDREKLSSSQRQQFISHQQQQQQQQRSPGVGATPSPFISAPSDSNHAGTTTTMTAMRQLTASSYPDGLAMAAVTGGHDGGAAVPSVQSIIQSQNAQRRQKQQSAVVVVGDASATGNSLTHPQPTPRRSSSYPTLCARGTPSNKKTKLRSIKSESDLTALRHLLAGGIAGGSSSFAAGGVATSSGSSFSTNNLYLGAKSEVCLKTLAVKNMHHSVQLFPSGGGPPGNVRSGGTGHSMAESGSGTQQSSKSRLYESRRASELSSSDFGANNKSELHLHKANGSAVRIPIVGYEVMEERARFTIFKLRIENSISHTCWLVLRRYTDFVRLNNKLRAIFPHCSLVLPRKKWFGDNFSSGFIDNRIQGLQTFINTILGDDVMRSCLAVRDFFCLDEPPSYSESMEESRVIFEAQEETISQLKQQLQTKEDLVQTLQTKLATETNRNALLTDVIRNSVENCAKCSKSIDQQLKDAVHK